MSAIKPKAPVISTRALGRSCWWRRSLGENYLKRSRIQTAAPEGSIRTSEPIRYAGNFPALM